MTDMELAEEIERYLAPDATYYQWMPSMADMEQIIAALRCVPERSLSGEMVMGLLGFVESGLLTNSRDIHDWRSDMESIRDVLTDWLSAAEASKEAK